MHLYLKLYRHKVYSITEFHKISNVGLPVMSSSIFFLLGYLKDHHDDFISVHKILLRSKKLKSYSFVIQTATLHLWDRSYSFEYLVDAHNIIFTISFLIVNNLYYHRRHTIFYFAICVYSYETRSIKSLIEIKF